MTTPVVEVAAGILIRSGDVLLGRRTVEQSFPLQWEFPGGKIEPGETPQEALEREFQEEVGLQVRCGELYETLEYVNAAGASIRVRFYRTDWVAGEARPLEVEAVRWIPVRDLAGVDFIPFNAVVVERLLAEAADGAS